MKGTNMILGGGGIHHVSMKVQDFDSSVKFYTEVMGLKQTYYWGEGNSRAVMLDTGDGAFIEIFAGGEQGEKLEGAFAHIALKVTKCDEIIETVRKAGMQVTKESIDIIIPSVPPLPVRIAFFKGPDGELIELFQNK